MQISFIQIKTGSLHVSSELQTLESSTVSLFGLLFLVFVLQSLFALERRVRADGLVVHVVHDVVVVVRLVGDVRAFLPGQTPQQHRYHTDQQQQHAADDPCRGDGRNTLKT